MNRNLNTLIIPQQLIKILIVVAILANAVGLFFPSLSSTFTPYYASIAKTMVQSGDWIDLKLLNQDWMDKPHFPFWVSAVSFKIFGINSFAYMLPGFIFNLLGAFFTYKLARFWFNRNVGFLAILFYLTTFHLMMSAIDVRAEAYLLGEIIPACYFWLRYDQSPKVKYLIWGAFFTALALMTKGIFILITITSGLIILWIYQKKYHNLISIKWWGALVLTFILTAPEFFALYYQFDMHPDKVVFGHTHVSGIRWFFWDSQFGRFFNTGPIMSTNPPPFHYLFFIHTFLWAFLPWSLLFIGILYYLWRYGLGTQNEREATLYLLSSFFITFILFSITKFQVDHYINIIFPFANIICAKWVVDRYNKRNAVFEALYYIQFFIAILLLFLSLILSLFILHGIFQIIIVSLALFYFIIIYLMRSLKRVDKLYLYPVLGILVTFVFAMFVNGVEYRKYDAGYMIAKYLNNQVPLNIVGYQTDLMSLNFYSNNPYFYIDSLIKLPKNIKQYYLVIKPENLKLLQKFNLNIATKQLASGCLIQTFLGNVFNPVKLEQSEDHYLVLEVKKAH